MPDLLPWPTPPYVGSFRGLAVAASVGKSRAAVLSQAGGGSASLSERSEQ